MEWGLVKNLIWFWALPAAWAIFYIASIRKKTEISRFGEPELIQRLVTSLNPRARVAKKLLLLLAIACMVTALGQPHVKKKDRPVEQKGVDVIIALDVSQSMLAKDIAPNRLDKAKLMLSGLVDKLKGDRIGIVAFAGEAVIQCPLTLDKNAAKLFLSTVSPNLVSYQGTSLTRAIATSAQAFADKEKDSKALILLTDGEDHEPDAIKAAERAKAAGIRIFTIGIGTSDGSTLPMELGAAGYKKDRSGQVVLSKLNEALLKDIAKVSGGSYHRSTRSEGEVDAIVRQIRQMTQKEMQSGWRADYEEYFQIFLLAALLFLMLEMAVSERKKTSPGPYALSVFLILMFCGFNFSSALQNEEGNKLYKKGQIGKAKSAYTKALQAEPESPEIAFNLGNAYYKEESFDKSLQVYEAAAKQADNASLQAKAHYNLGNSLVRQNSNQKAIDSYKEALRLNPKDEDAKYNLELLMKRQDEKKEDKKEDKKDEKKDQKDKDKEKKEQDKQDQEKQDKDQGQPKPDNQEQQEKKDQQGSGSAGKDDQKDQSQEGQGQDKGQPEESEGQEEKPDEGQGSEKEKEPDKGQPQDQGSEGKPGQEQKDQESSAEEKQGQPGSGAEPADENQEKPGTSEGQAEAKKSDAQIRAEQILGALENQEQQVLKFQNSNERARPMVRRTAEKDW